MEASATLLAQVPAARFVPHNTAQDLALPRITYQMLSAGRVHAMGDDTGQCRALFQVASWADTRTGALTIADLVRKAVNRYTGTISSVVVQSVFMTDGGEGEMPRNEAGAYGVYQTYELTFLEAQ